MVSKAFDKSNDTMENVQCIEHFNLMSTLSVTYSIKALPASIIDILLRKPNCLLFIIILFSINELILVFINFSNILDKIGKIDTVYNSQYYLLFPFYILELL